MEQKEEERSRQLGGTSIVTDQGDYKEPESPGTRCAGLGLVILSLVELVVWLIGMARRR